MAEDWRNCAESVKRTYKEKAQRFNVEEERRWRQKVGVQHIVVVLI